MLIADEKEDPYISTLPNLLQLIKLCVVLVLVIFFTTEIANYVFLLIL